MQRILFVCSGNTCRSPMAEVLLRKELQAYSAKQLQNLLEIRSAGIMAGAGSPASPEAIKVMAEQGMDLSQHRSQRLNEHLLQWADLVLTMTESHRQYIISEYANQSDKVHTLAQFSGIKHIDIVDPFGSGIQTYRQSARQLQQLIRQLVKKIMDMK